ncbi:MAG: DHH family phosphoesterase [Candidatus Diapherotrites archaeon]
MISGPQLKKKFREFALNLNSKDSIAVIHHTDADGISSAAIAFKAIQKLTGRRPFLLQQNYGESMLGKKVLKFLKRKKVNKLIILDLNIDQHSYKLKKLKGVQSILILDHHKIFKDSNSKKILFIKSQFLKKIDGSKYPTAKLCFDLFSEVIDLRKEKWIACIGLYGDFAQGSWRPFIRKTCKENRIRDCSKFFVEAKELFGAVETIKPKKIPELVKISAETRNPNELLKSKFHALVKEFRGEVRFWEKKAKSRAEFFPELELIFYVFKPLYPVKSHLINLMAQKFPHNTIIVLQEKKNFLELSARRQDFRLPVNEMLEHATKDLPQALGGGHIPAAGGRIRKKDLGKFKQNAMNFIKKNYSV